MTDETAKSLIEAIDRLVVALGRASTVNHYHHQVAPLTVYPQPTQLQQPLTPYWTITSHNGSAAQ